MKSHCDQFALHSADSIAHIHSNLRCHNFNIIRSEGSKDTIWLPFSYYCLRKWTRDETNHELLGSLPISASENLTHLWWISAVQWWCPLLFLKERAILKKSKSGSYTFGKSLIRHFKATLCNTPQFDPFQPGMEQKLLWSSPWMTSTEEQMGEKSANLMVHLNFSHVFHINRRILMWHHPGSILLQWLWSYLEGRIQRMLLDDFRFTSWPLGCHKVLFSSISTLEVGNLECSRCPTPINPSNKIMGIVTWRFGQKCHQYADGTKLLSSIL